MSEINLKTWKRAKLLISGFKDFAERVTEELLEPRDRHSFIVQYIISFSVCIKAQRNCCAHKQKCFPMPQRRCKLDWSCVCAVCSQRPAPGKPRACGTHCSCCQHWGLKPLPAPQCGLRLYLRVRPELFSYMSAECQMNSAMSGSFGIVFAPSFQPVAVQYPRQKSSLC